MPEHCCFWISLTLQKLWAREFVSDLTSLDDQVKEWNEKLVKENKNLHRFNTPLKQAEFEEQKKLDNLEYEITKSRMRKRKLEGNKKVWTKEFVVKMA